MLTYQLTYNLGINRHSLISEIRKIKGKYTSIAFSTEILDSVPITDLAEVIEHIPLHFDGLSFQGCELNRRSSDDLITLFKAISVHITTLDLTRNCFFDHAKDLSPIFAAIHRNLKTLKFRQNYFSKSCYELFLSLDREANQWMSDIETAFLELPPHLQTLDLTNSLADSIIMLNKILKNLNQKQLITLILAHNYLEKYTEQEMIEILSSIPSNTQRLSLQSCRLGLSSMSATAFSKGLSKLPNNIHSLSLSDNFDSDWWKKKDAFIILKALNPTIKTLDLSLTKFPKGSTALEHVVEFITNIPISVTTLYAEQLWIDSNHVPALIKAIPKQVAKVSIGQNGLLYDDSITYGTRYSKVYNTGVGTLKSNQQLKELFSLFNETVTSIEFRYDLRECDPEVLKDIILALPSNIESITIGERTVVVIDYFADHIVKGVSKLLLENGYEKFDFSSVHQPFEFNEQLTKRLIATFSEKNTALSWFCCALLSQGAIENYISCPPEDAQKIIETHHSEAVCHYMKAIKNCGPEDSRLKELAQFLLWELKATSEFESVQSLLEKENLQPPVSYIGRLQFFGLSTEIPVELYGKKVSGLEEFVAVSNEHHQKSMQRV